MAEDACRPVVEVIVTFCTAEIDCGLRWVMTQIWTQKKWKI